MNFNNLGINTFIELQEFLRYTTGNPYVYGNQVRVEFIDEEAVAMTVSTCTKTFTMSTRISDFRTFSNALHHLMTSTHFTMP